MPLFIASFGKPDDVVHGNVALLSPETMFYAACSLLLSTCDALPYFLGLSLHALKVLGSMQLSARYHKTLLAWRLLICSMKITAFLNLSTSTIFESVMVAVGARGITSAWLPQWLSFFLAFVVRLWSKPCKNIISHQSISIHIPNPLLQMLRGCKIRDYVWSWEMFP